MMLAMKGFSTSSTYPAPPTAPVRGLSHFAELSAPNWCVVIVPPQLGIT